LRDKYSLEEAFKRGNKLSFTSILDANVTSLLVAVILFILGESSVKGFATMLIISIIVSMIIMVYLLRALLKSFVKSGWFDNRYKSFVGIKNLDKKNFLERFNYGKYMRGITVITTILLIIGIFIFVEKGFNLGIDFKGGSSISLISKEPIKAENIKKDIEKLGYEVDKFDNLEDNSVYLTVSNVFKAEDNEKVVNYFNGNYEGITTNIGAISNTVKQQLVNNAIKALIYAFIGLIIYVTIRFTFSFSIGTIAGVAHDVIVVGIAFSIFGFEVTSIFVAAILSIIGYSINDTIVVFDRVRENRKKIYNNKIKNKEELRELINISIKETVMRNLVTAITTIIAVVALIVFGSNEIANFNYALLIGFIAGAYSSLFITSEVYYLIESRRIGKPDKKKWYDVDNKDDIEELKVKGINC
jgi:SecD/SecF fusion protein